MSPYISFYVEVPQAEETEEEPIQEGQTQSQAAQSMPMESSSNAPAGGEPPTAPAGEPPVESNEEAATPGFGFWLAVPALCGALLIMRRARC